MSKLVDLFSNEDGKLSIGHVATACMVVSAICWVSYLIGKTQKLPDFSGISLFIGTLFGLDHLGTSLNTYLEGKNTTSGTTTATTT